MAQFKSIVFSTAQFCLIILLGSIFLSVGYDLPQALIFREFILAVLFGAFLVLVVTKNASYAWLKSPTLWMFFLFICFQIVRAFWANFQFGTEQTAAAKEILKYCAQGYRSWLLYGAAFLSALFFCFERKLIWRIYAVISGFCFFLALNAIPPTLFHHAPYYISPDGKTTFFFYPLFYRIAFAQDILIRYVHPNSISDIIGVGFFSAAVLGLYLLFQFNDKSSGNSLAENRKDILFAKIAFYFLISSICACGVLILLSRGGMVAWAVGTFVMIGFMLVKLRKQNNWLILLVSIGLIGGLILWAGNFERVKRELRTLENEESVLTADKPVAGQYHYSSSIFFLRSGIRSSKLIHQKYPDWGVGTNGYSLVFDRSKGGFLAEAAKNDIWFSYELAKAYAMSHYFQIWAEEGRGAYLYYLFLLAYLIETAWKLYRVKSRFQFLLGLGLYSAVIMFLVHVIGIWSMQRFTTSLLVYVLMGLSLGVLRPDFQHQVKKVKSSEETIPE